MTPSSPYEFYVKHQRRPVDEADWNEIAKGQAQKMVGRWMRLTGAALVWATVISWAVWWLGWVDFN